MSVFGIYISILVFGLVVMLLTPNKKRGTTESVAPRWVWVAVTVLVAYLLFAGSTK